MDTIKKALTYTTTEYFVNQWYLCDAGDDIIREQ